MKTVKTRLQNRLAVSCPSNLMKIVTEGPEELSDIDLIYIQHDGDFTYHFNCATS